jgi:hypothetical protein
MRLIKDNLPLPRRLGPPTLAIREPFMDLKVNETMIVEPDDYDGTVNALRSIMYHWAIKMGWQVSVRSMVDGLYVKRIK